MTSLRRAPRPPAHPRLALVGASLLGSSLACSPRPPLVDDEGSSGTSGTLEASSSGHVGLDTSGTSEASTSEATEGLTSETTEGSSECEPSEHGAVVPVREGCCGCLCGQTGWSCSQDTCLLPDGTAAILAPEAGFLELEHHEYWRGGVARSSPISRVWYSFWPADEAPESRPLLLLFNGGPGFATMILFGGNTAPFSLDPQLSASYVPTSRPWTERFNLLYVDPPATGFSYDRRLPDGTELPVATDPELDASAFVSVLLRFLARHPQLQHNPVVLLGESYGGTRAMLMLHQLLDYEALVDPRSTYRNDAVHGEIARHLAGLYPESCGRGVSRDEIAAQFGHMVTVQGLVAGLPQLLPTSETSPQCIPGGDSYHCDRPDGWLDDIGFEIAARMRQPALLETVLGVDPTTIAWMHADAREDAHGRVPQVPEPAMTAVFGTLGPDDAYYLSVNAEAYALQGGALDYFDPAIADTFLRVGATVDVFMTDGRLDNLIKTYALPPVLAMREAALTSALYDDAPRDGVARPGWFQLEYVAGWAPGGVTTRELRVPRYDAAGHAITLDEPEALLDDLTAWLAEGS